MQHVPSSPTPWSPATDPASSTLPSMDLYGPVHKGLRWALSTSLLRSGTLDVGRRESVWNLIDDLDGVFSLCAAHLEHEERAMHPVLERCWPGVTERTEREHERHRRDLDDLWRLVDRLAEARPEVAPVAARDLYLSLSAFTAETLLHMDHEERELQPVFDRFLSPTELEQLHADIVGAIGPEEMDAFMRVMLPGNDQNTRASMLGGAQAGMAPAAFADMLEGYRGLLTPRDWSDLTRRLGVTL